MKKTTLLSGLLAVLFSFNATAEIICYGEEESQTPDFWVNHFYYAKCTDYVGSGSKSFEDTDYVDFNGESSVDFTNVFVPEDGTYTVQLSYGVGYADADGAVVTINVNNELADQLIVYTLTGAPPAIYEFDVELWGDYNNVIQLKQVKDWMTTLGIQLVPKGGVNAIPEINEIPYKISSGKGTLSINNLKGSGNQIRINSLDGKLLRTVTTKSSSFNMSLASGIYIIHVNGKASKVLIK
jgi:hypothetical protein